MFINVNNYNISFIVPKKSGNKLIYSSLMHLFKIYGIDYTISSDTGTYEKNCYLFVRNPVDRFFSSYDWFLRLCNSTTTLTPHDESIKTNTIEIFNHFEIKTLLDYINNYVKFINTCQDFHYLPQSSFFITKTVDNGVRTNLNLNYRKSYDNAFPDNYKIFRIEEIDEQIEKNIENLKLLKYGDNFLLNKTISDYGIKKFSFLNFLPENMSAKFMIIYRFFQSYYAVSHHSEDKNYYFNQISINDYISVCDMFKKESIFLGYDDNIDTVRKYFKKNLM